MKKTVIIAAILLVTASSFSEEKIPDSLSADGHIMPSQGTVGEAIKYVITVSGPGAGESEVFLPEERVRYADKDKDESSKASGSVPLYVIGSASRGQSSPDLFRAEVEVTFYRPGIHELPLLKIIDSQGREVHYHVPLVEIVSLNQEGLFQPLEGPLELRGNYTRLYLLFMALIIAAALFIPFYRFAQRIIKADFTMPLPVPAIDIFLSEIEKMNPEILISEGHVHRYVFDISIIFRRYISSLYGFDAAEMTTEEIMGRLSKVMPSPDYEKFSTRTGEIMNFWDLSKFAEFKPSRDLLLDNLHLTLDTARRLSQAGGDDA